MEIDLKTVNASLGGFNESLGLQFTEVTPDRAVAIWTAGPQHHQSFGIVNGGVHAAVVETVGSIGANVWLNGRGHSVGVNNNTDFYRPVSEGELTSTGTPIHRGRTQQVWLIETHDTEGRLVARGQLRLHNIDDPSLSLPVNTHRT